MSGARTPPPSRSSAPTDERRSRRSADDRADAPSPTGRHGAPDAPRGSGAPHGPGPANGFGPTNGSADDAGSPAYGPSGSHAPSGSTPSPDGPVPTRRNRHDRPAADAPAPGPQGSGDGRHGNAGTGEQRPGDMTSGTRVGLRVRGGPVPREPGAPAPRPSADPDAAPSGRRRAPQPEQSRPGTPPNGARPDGTPADGVPPHGPANGAPPHGGAANGTRTRRVGADTGTRGGATAPGATTQGSAANGTRHRAPTDTGAHGTAAAPDGAAPNGAPQNGAARNDVPPNGAPTTGVPSNGHAPYGAPPRGFPPNGAPPNGAQPNGAQPNGAQPNGGQPNGLPPHGGRAHRAPADTGTHGGAAEYTTPTGTPALDPAPPNGARPAPSPAPHRPTPGRRSGRHGAPEAPEHPGTPAVDETVAAPLRGSGPPPVDPSETTGLLTHGGPTARPIPGPDQPTSLTPAVDGATGLLPSTPHDDDLVDHPDEDQAAADPGRTRVTGGRRHAAAGTGGPLDRARALVGPGLQTVRTRLGILDADEKAALSPEQLRTRRRKQVRYGLIGSAASVVLLPLLLFGLGWLIFSVPTPDEAVNNQIATVSFADGGQLARLVPEQGNRIKVPMEEIPPHVREAVLAAEDRSFYTNPGFDLTGILRAVWKQVQGEAGGGSTITQQYVKTTLVGNDPTYLRKFKELIVSLKVSQQKTKDEVLNEYLNAIYFGRGAYGIQSASLAYFGKPVNAISPSEAALLAGVIQSPSRWDPANDAAKARERWSFVMDGMAQQNWISRADRAAAQFPVTIPSGNSSTSSSLTDDRGHILNAVKTELSNLGISDQAFAQGGLQVTTTIDPGRQRELADAVEAKTAGQPDVLRTGAVAIDPRTGGIVGYYGGKDGTGIDYAKVLKQPGSTFKPFAVLAGLMQEPPIGLGQKFDGSEQPGLRNAEGANCPRCDLKQALTISNNVVFTKLAAEVGPQKVADAARLAGITQPLENPDARLALGNTETTPVQLASAYATIAAGGVWHAPHMVSKVVDSDGRVLYEYQPGEGEQRFPEQVARNVTEAMLNVVDHDDLDLPGGQEAAGKTGTVQSRFEGENNDAWFAGFTPDLVSTVWVGTDRNDPIRDADGEPISGAMLPGKIWQSFMSDAVRGADETSEFPTFRPIGKAPADEQPNAPTQTASPPATTTSAQPTRQEQPPAAPERRESETTPPAAPPAAPLSATDGPAPDEDTGPGDDAADDAGRTSEPTVG